MGNYININLSDKISGNFRDYVLSNPLYMHEHGHTLDSRGFGPAYLFFIGLPSIISAAGDGNHDTFWTEMRANSYAKLYFGKYYGVDWNAYYKNYWIDDPVLGSIEVPGTIEYFYPTY